MGEGDEAIVKLRLLEGVAVGEGDEAIVKLRLLEVDGSESIMLKQALLRAAIFLPIQW